MKKISLNSRIGLQKKKSKIALGIRLFVFLSVIIFYLVGLNYSTKNLNANQNNHGRKLLSIINRAEVNDNIDSTKSRIQLILSESSVISNKTNLSNSVPVNDDTFTTVYENFTTSTSSATQNDSISEKYQQEQQLDNCTPPAIDEFPSDGFSRNERRQGWITIHIILACYCFWLLATVCDDYFVPAIETMCFSFKMKEDIVGATFMAAATSSPELFINCVGTFVTKGDIGVGTIVGSAVFNILAVPACCGLFAGQIVNLDWWPVSRDCLMYCIAVLGLIATLYDGKVMWYEALILVLAYFFYMFAMYCNDAMARKARKLISKCRRKSKIRPFKEVTEISPLLLLSSSSSAGNCSKNDIIINTCDKSTMITSSFESISNDSDTIEFADEPWTRGDNGLFVFLCRWPITLLLWLTIPDCRKHPRFRLITFFLSIVWIGATSYLVAFFITIIGDTLNIPDSVMGLTILAAGMSVPEAVSSVIVTNQGHGGMGISNSIGSNTFDILLCLGLPWFIKAYFVPVNPDEKLIQLNSSGLTYSAISLLTTLFGLYIAFVANKFRLDWKIGVACMIMYIGFLIFAIMIESNFFFFVNLPVCEH